MPGGNIIGKTVSSLTAIGMCSAQRRARGVETSDARKYILD